jgi:hypothetical protein
MHSIAGVLLPMLGHHEREENFPIHVFNSRIFNGKREKGKIKEWVNMEKPITISNVCFCCNGTFNRIHNLLKNN